MGLLGALKLMSGQKVYLSLSLQKKTGRPRTMPNDSLYPANPQAKEFLSYFAHHWDFITAPTGTKDWQTITNYKLQPRILWHKFQDPQNILGLRFGKLTKYCMADIDRESSLHFMNNPQAFRDLCQAFEQIGLCRFVILFSSYSEGVHIYFPLTEEVNSFNLACALRMAVENAGFKIKSGQLELFPNTKTYKKNTQGKNFSHFNGHRLPLQPETGSILLDDDLNPYSQDLGAFFGQMEWAAQRQDIEKLKDTLAISRDWYRKRQYRFAQTSNSSKIKQWQEDTEALIEEGFSDYGQTNELIREIGKYGRVFLALGSKELKQYILETITNLQGYKEYCRHQTEIQQRCDHWAKIIEPFWWPLGTTPTRHSSYQEMNQQGQQTVKNSQLNQERTTECQERLKQTLEHLIQQAITLPKKVGERLKLLCQTSKEIFGKAFSQRTLKKLTYLPLWHPKFDKEQSEPETEIITTTTIKNTTPDPIPEAQHHSNFSPLQKEENILQQPIRLEALSNKQSSEKITPPDVVRKDQPKTKSPEPMLDKQSRKKDHTFSLMKGFKPDSEFVDSPTSVERSQTVSGENDNQQIQKKGKPKKRNQKSHSENITKTYGQEIPENPPKLDKDNLSEPQKYYQEVLNRHPELKALDDERQQPEYQKGMKNLFAEVNEILKRKSQSRRFE